MKKPLLTDFFWVSAASYTSNALRLVRGLALAKILGPGAFGVWTAMRLTESLSQFLPLGSRSGVLQLASAADGKGEVSRAANLRSTAAGMSASVGCAIAAVAGAAAFLFAGDETKTAWLVFAVVILGSHIFNFGQVNLRSQRCFKLAGFNQVLLAFLTTIAAIFATRRFGLEGFLIFYALAYFAVFLIMLQRRSAFPVPSLDAATGRDLIHAGFPIMAGQALGLLLWNTDKLLLWWLASTQALGIYAIQASFSSIVLLMPNAIAAVLHPHLRREIGRRSDASVVQPYLTVGSELLALVAAPVVCAAFLALHLPIHWWLTEYTDAVPPGRILMLAAYFSMVGAVPATVLISLSRQRQLCVIRVIALVAGSLTGIIAITTGFGLVGLACATSLGLVSSYFMTQGATLSAARIGRQMALKHGISCITPLGLGLAGIAVGHLVFPDVPITLREDILITVQRIGLLLLFTAPWILWRAQKLKILERLDL